MIIQRQRLNGTQSTAQPECNMNKILPTLLAIITKHPRHKVENIKFDNLVTYNLFRLWEIIFWRRSGSSGNPNDTIRAEAVSYWGIDEYGVIHQKHIFFTWESMIVHFEGLVRNYFSRVYKSLKTFKLPEIYINLQPQFAFEGFQIIPKQGDKPRGFLFAIAADATSDSTNKGSTTPATTSHTVTGSNPFLWIHVHTAVVPPTVTACSYAGAGSTQNSHGNLIDGTRLTDAWYNVAPSTGANNISVTLSAAPVAWNFGGSSYSGVDQTTPIDVQTFAVVALTMTLSMTTTVDNDWLIGSGAADTAFDAGSGTTKRGTVTGLDACGFIDSNGAKTPTGTYSIIALDTAGGANSGGAFGAAIKPVATPATIRVGNMLMMFQ